MTGSLENVLGLSLISDGPPVYFWLPMNSVALTGHQKWKMGFLPVPAMEQQSSEFTKYKPTAHTHVDLIPDLCTVLLSLNLIKIHKLITLHL